jgi:signal transduction histidine kinase
VLRFNMPKLRIYQQILLCFGLIVSLPLLGTTFIINGVNQQALRKELARFSEHTAEALYRDFDTEMSWQKLHSRMMSRLMVSNLQGGKSFEPAARQIADIDPDVDALGLYDRQGHLLQSYYRNFDRLSPELRLPDDLPRQPDGLAAAVSKLPPSPRPESLLSPNLALNPSSGPINGPTFQPFSVLYFSTGSPQESPYYLRAVLSLQNSAATPLKLGSSRPGILDNKTAAYYVQLKHFPYLQNLVRANNSLYDAFYIIDNDGVIIAGPEGAARQERISPRDYAQFKKIQPGVTHEFSSSSQASYDNDLRDDAAGGDRSKSDSDESPALKKVIVKMPEINWGIIIESPYHVKRKYIRQAAVNTFLLSLGCLALMLLLVLPYILGISRNFRQLLKGVKAMGDGNYFRRIRLLTNYFTPYEIVYLTLEFNRMARKTADSWQAIQEANRKLAQMDEFKSGLIDTVSHELRTPLTSIKGYTSRLLRYDSTLDAETRVKSLKIVKQQADRLGRLVEDLLVIPDLDQDNLRVFPDQVALYPLLEEAILLVQARYAASVELEQRPITLDWPQEMSHEQAVFADPDRLEQILINLLDNAMKYSIPETPIQLRVAQSGSIIDGQQGGGAAVIEVSNACEAIALESLDSLFEKFKRLDDSLVRTTRGSGLGLFITRGLVEAMGGRIDLSYAERRFTVHCRIPLTPLETVD